MKYLVIVAFIAIIGSLAAALVYMMRGGSATEADGKRLRIDTWVEAGCEIPPYFDPMIAKVICWAPTREQARADLHQALGDSVLYGVETNRDYLRQILLAPPFANGRPWTRCSPHTVRQPSCISHPERSWANRSKDRFSTWVRISATD